MASLAKSGLVVTVQVAASDDPNGRVAFASFSRELSVAEDFYPGNEASTRATFVVERRQGNQNLIKVCCVRFKIRNLSKNKVIYLKHFYFFKLYLSVHDYIQIYTLFIYFLLHRNFFLLWITKKWKFTSVLFDKTKKMHFQVSLK